MSTQHNLFEAQAKALIVALKLLGMGERRGGLGSRGTGRV
jgi:hypothetical protein